MINSLSRSITNKKYRIIQIDSEINNLQESIDCDLSELTFLIPVRIDSIDRENNLNLTIDYLNHHFKTNIIVCEESAVAKLKYLENKCYYFHEKTDDPNIHRTKILNNCAKLAKTPFISIWDTDALLSIQQILATYQCLKNDQADLIYPYDGRFLELPKSAHQEIINNKYNLSFINDDMLRVHHTNALGGAVFFNKNNFFQAGMMNENFKSYGWEDNELLVRFYRLGYRIARVDGPFIHLEHYRGADSSLKNPYTQNNQQEWLKVQLMPKRQLTKYVKTFPWMIKNI